MHLLALCCAVWILISGFTAQAQPASPIVKTQLEIDATQLRKGSTIWAGVTFTIPEHWHIYWQNPGDTGLATEYEWQLPNGVEAGEIHWPVPERQVTGGLINYGYSTQVTLPVPFTLTRDGVSGTLRVTAKWLVCDDVCIPEKATLTAPLPGQSAHYELLAEARDAVPSETMPGQFTATDDTVTLALQLRAAGLSKVAFFPIEDGVITNSGPQTVKADKSGNFTLVMERGSLPVPATWHGVLRYTRGTAQHDVVIVAKNTDPSAAAAEAEAQHVPLWLALGLAFLGGLLLNIMPCVLPILALKALALAKKAGLSRAQAVRQGAAYTAGVVVSFLAIACIMLALKASGAAVGWGFQLQNGWFVGVLAGVMLLVAANLLDLFTLPALFGRASMQADDTRLSGAFLTGLLAVLVATPCTAPFMATAIGATLALPTLLALMVFAVLGLGMAFPFLLISLWPAARRLLPKPGPWMKRFKQMLAMFMLATALWLSWVLAQLQQPAVTGASFSQQTLTELRAVGKGVLVDVTADWCLTCKLNERVALQPPEMEQFLHERNIILLVADWTSGDPAITDYLTQFKRGGVPLYVYYPPGKPPVVLPQILTPSLIRSVVNEPTN